MSPAELLKKGLTELGFLYSEEQINEFMSFLEELKKWSRAYNLTGLKKDEDIIIRHFLDSALYLKVLPPRVNSLADAGTGAGFPGIPIKIMRPGIDITLMEPSRKKAAFLRHSVRKLKLRDMSILNKRVEDLGKTHEKEFDVIVSRATFKADDFLKKAGPFVKDNGILILSKGPKFIDEIRKLKNRKIIREVMTFSFYGIERNLLIIEPSLS